MESNENESVIRAAREFGDVQVIQIKDGEGSESAVLSVPSGRKVESIKPFFDEYRGRPERRAGTATLTTIESFIEHANRFKDANSAIFADVQNRAEPKLISVIDYHEAGPDEHAARFCAHRGVYRFPVSDEWKAWSKKVEPMGQAEFAAFLEERIMDVLDPSAAGENVKAFASDLGIALASPQRLMELSRGLTISVGQKVVQHANLSSGEARIGFEEQHVGEGGAALTIPGGFALAIPVFRGGALYQVPVRMRYRVANGAVAWWFAPARTDRVWDHAINEACSKVKADTALPLLFGTPE